MMRSLVVLLGLCSCVSAAEQIVSNVPLDAAPSTYTILALPSNYESNAVSMDLVRGFDTNKDLVEVRRNSSFVAYEDGHAEFEHRWQSSLPEVSQGKPVVLVMEGNQVLYKRTGATSKKVSAELRERGILKRLKERRNPAPVDPNQPNPNLLNCNPAQPVQPVNPIPETPIDEEPLEEEANTGTALAALLVLGAAVWAGVFAFRSQQ